MTVSDLITDEAVRIVFQGTNFGSISPREVIAKDLKQVSDGYHIGHTAKCCLLELGLIKCPAPRKMKITTLGRRYLEILNQ